MKRVLFVATVVKTHIMTFHVPYLKMLKEMGYETAVASRNDYEDPKDCVIPYCDNFYDIPFERSPLKPTNFKAYQALKKIIDEGEYELIHCHTPVGAMLTRLAAIGARKRGTKVIYTAHGFHFFKGAPLINWLLYFPVEWFLARFTDGLITINKEDYTCAQKFAAKKVCYIPGIGIDTNKFSVSEDVRREKRSAIRDEMGIPGETMVLLSVGELIPRKNHRVVIEAISKIDNDNLYYVICGRGPLMEKYKEVSQSLGISDRVILTGFRNDVADFFCASDIFVFPSLQEGLPVAVMEAMASGIPTICSRVRGCTDLIEEKRTGYFAKNDSEDMAQIIQHVIEHEEERMNCAIAAKQHLEQYALDNVLEHTRKIYLELLAGKTS